MSFGDLKYAFDDFDIRLGVPQTPEFENTVRSRI